MATPATTARGRREAEVAGPAALARASSARSTRKTAGTHLSAIDADPGHAGERGRPAAREGQRTEHEGHHERVVVTAAGEVNGEERVPADERRGEARGGGRAIAASPTIASIEAVASPR